MTSSESAYAGGELTYDVFLSYAHVNNHPDGGAWVSEFHKQLRAKLDERLGRSGRAKFFFDTGTLGKNVEFGPQIEEALRKSATVVAVISQGYIESPNCREELRFFDDHVVPGPVSQSRRLYLVWYDAREAQSEWPEAYRDEFTRRVQGILGYECCAPVPGVPSGRPLSTSDPEYQTSLLRITTELATYINKSRNRPATTAPAKPGRILPPSQLPPSTRRFQPS
ncbi:MAG: toll/interleukin-1 receptor domain-containing protein [Candidatus Tectomicrobia bacterium]|nr:toll/interleukin-1 receptor domain-containing protein [Candidatus Tectomicrobia bacterium]